MEIERSRGLKVKVRLNDLPCGEVFEHKEILFMKADKMSRQSKEKDGVFAVNIGNGWIAVFSKNTLVHPVQAKVVVNE